jgi:LuxR family transcriptional regulator, maltose regulon positive regulatory protein
MSRWEGQTLTPKQQLLMTLSYLPQMTLSMAVALTGTPSSSGLLEDMHRRHLFVDRRTGNELVYQFHALFRAFLRDRADASFKIGDRQAIARHAARLLDEAGRPDEAFPLAIGAQDFGGATRIVLQRAAGLISQGRWEVVVSWIESLPKDQVSGNSWLLHWHGIAMIAIAPAHARTLLETCYAISSVRGDEMCELQAAAGIVQTYLLEYTAFRPIDR